MNKIISTIVCMLLSIGMSFAEPPVKNVLLDTHFNHEVDKKTGKVQHYTWDDTSKWGGYSMFGELFVKHGGTLLTLNEAPTAELLEDCSVYIIVDPDHVKDNPKPNYMDERSADAIAQWVRKGGSLLVLTNDRDNCDLKYINILMDKFGLHFNDTTILQLEIPTKEKPENVYPLQGVLPGVDKMYMRGTSSIKCSGRTRPLVWTKDNDVIIAEARFGKGTVIAIADPWVYNEYIYHTLLPNNYDNASAAERIIERLMERDKIEELDPNAHDPVMAKGEDGRYYVFMTGMNVGVMSSADLKAWRYEPSALKDTPQWAMVEVKGYRGHTWAPDISYHNGQWYLYYSCSTFGKNGSAIGLATNKTLDPSSADFKWEDKGMVIASHRKVDNWNAIDPNLIVDKKGQPWLTFGSFWDGIQLVKLSKKDFKTPVSKPVTVARRVDRRISHAEMLDSTRYEIEGGNVIEAGENAIEAPFIFYHDGYYYMFVSFDYCCRGQASTYKTVYGRSKKVQGPYLDKTGKPMEYGGGTRLYGPNDKYFGVGHCSAYQFDDKCYFVSHAYEKDKNGAAKLFIRPLNFDNEGWIISEE